MYSKSKHELFAELDVLMGGRVAEELVFGPSHVTTGASNDLERATQIARRMVVKWGMSDRVGMLAVDEDGEKLLSAQTKQAIDEEVAKLLKVLRVL
jgi:ATP-dependent Zn protease